MTVNESIVGRIYEAALVPGQWIDVLEELAKLSGCFGGLLVSGRDHVPNRAIVTERLEAVHDRATQDGW